MSGRAARAAKRRNHLLAQRNLTQYLIDTYVPLFRQFDKDMAAVTESLTIPEQYDSSHECMRVTNTGAVFYNLRAKSNER